VRQVARISRRLRAQLMGKGAVVEVSFLAYSYFSRINHLTSVLGHILATWAY